MQLRHYHRAGHLQIGLSGNEPAVRRLRSRPLSRRPPSLPALPAPPIPPPPPDPPAPALVSPQAPNRWVQPVLLDRALRLRSLRATAGRFLPTRDLVIPSARPSPGRLSVPRPQHSAVGCLPHTWVAALWTRWMCWTAPRAAAMGAASPMGLLPPRWAELVPRVSRGEWRCGRRRRREGSHDGAACRTAGARWMSGAARCAPRPTASSPPPGVASPALHPSSALSLRSCDDAAILPCARQPSRRRARRYHRPRVQTGTPSRW
eukprot:scaffold46079_cov75-Phaeocystis_antarctica.AAC.5